MAALGALGHFSSANLFACAACFGQSDSSMAKGMNMGIFSLLLIISCVLFSIAGFFVYLVHRSSQMAAVPEQIASELTETPTNG